MKQILLRLKEEALDKNLAHFLEDGAKVKTLSKIKPSLLYSKIRTTCIQNQRETNRDKGGHMFFVLI